MSRHCIHAGTPDGGGATIWHRGVQFPKDVILFAAFFYVCYTVWYRDLEESMAERGVRVDHATLNRWVARYFPLIASTDRRRKAPTDRSRRVDETYVKVKGEWVYLYRDVDKLGQSPSTYVDAVRNGMTKAERGKKHGHILGLSN